MSKRYRDDEGEDVWNALEELRDYIDSKVPHGAYRASRMTVRVELTVEEAHAEHLGDVFHQLKTLGAVERVSVSKVRGELLVVLFTVSDGKALSEFLRQRRDEEI